MRGIVPAVHGLRDAQQPVLFGQLRTLHALRLQNGFDVQCGMNGEEDEDTGDEDMHQPDWMARDETAFPHP